MYQENVMEVKYDLKRHIIRHKDPSRLMLSGSGTFNIQMRISLPETNQ